MRTLDEAKQYLRKNFDAGAECPCCGQNVKLYKRTLNSGIARSLISYYRIAGRNWLHYGQTVASRHRDFSLGRFWGLLESQDKRTLTDKGSGIWRLTDKVFGFSGGDITIRDALGERFDYAELMGNAYAS